MYEQGKGLVRDPAPDKITAGNYLSELCLDIAEVGSHIPALFDAVSKNTCVPKMVDVPLKT